MNPQKRDIIVIAHDIRSSHNIGSILRTADGFGISRVYITGLSPYPINNQDTRLPHIALKQHKQIQKTALGAENSVNWQQSENITQVIQKLRDNNYTIAALEQADQSVMLDSYNPPDKIAIILGNEVNGVSKTLINLSDICLEIPMLGKKESFNVAQAAAITMYHLRFYC